MLLVVAAAASVTSHQLLAELRDKEPDADGVWQYRVLVN